MSAPDSTWKQFLNQGAGRRDRTEPVVLLSWGDRNQNSEKMPQAECAGQHTAKKKKMNRRRQGKERTPEIRIGVLCTLS